MWDLSRYVVEPAAGFVVLDTYHSSMLLGYPFSMLFCIYCRILTIFDFLEVSFAIIKRNSSTWFWIFE